MHTYVILELMEKLLEDVGIMNGYEWHTYYQC